PRLVGRGGMGEIYVAEDTVLGRQVAIKLLDERFARDEQVRARFTREALTAAKLSGHPNIVTIFDVGEEAGRPFIVMEYLSGGTIADRARSGPVRHDEALAWLAQAAGAIDEAHSLGVVHRDVKPANLLLDERGTVHVADFGIARVADESTAGMTAAGTVLGTAGYLSPEQARGEPATPASDVYALAIVAYELLTGGRPFEGGSATAEAAAHINQPVPPASERAPGVPPEVDGVFARALAKQPGARHARASEFVGELRGALLRSHQQTRIAPAPLAAPVRSERRANRHRRPERPGSGSRWVPAVVAGLLVAALAAGGVLAAVMASDGGGEAEQAPPTEPQKVKTVTQSTTVEGEPTTVIQTTTAEAPPEPASQGGGGGRVSHDEAVALTDEATGLMNAGDYASALPLARRAYKSLRGSGDIYEAYAAYNTGKSYIELGNCQKGLPLLDASEAIQGQRSQIDAARAQCQASGDDD
ncbi:MAG TPA: serine/threonine-protein kinase, partial [Gaiellaceae bacterium]|nr:serine/threonine-protein kinase [Gaiellaceae bacterium]